MQPEYEEAGASLGHFYSLCFTVSALEMAPKSLEGHPITKFTGMSLAVRNKSYKTLRLWLDVTQERLGYIGRNGKLLIAMLTELRPGMSVKQGRQVTNVRTTGTTQCGKRNNE